jgi:hypothetical protein
MTSAKCRPRNGAGRVRLTVSPYQTTWNRFATHPGLEAYRLHRITGSQFRTLLGLPSRWDLHALLNERQIDMYTVEDFEQDLKTIEEFRKKRKA